MASAAVSLHCTGHLLKPGRIIRSNRKRRYFELVGHNLYYFASHAVAARGIGAAKGFDSLQGLQSVMLGDLSGATVPIHLVLANDAEAVYYVQQGSAAESFEDAKRWIAAFTQLVPKKIKSVIQGELEHSLDRGHTWTRRFVMLLPDELVLFENEAATQRYSADPLACAVARLKFTDEFFAADAPGGSHQNSFQVCDFETSYYLAAPDPQLKMFWMLAISRIIEKMLETAAEITRRSFKGARVLAQNPLADHAEAKQQEEQQAVRDRTASEHMSLGNKPRGRLLYDFEAENDGEISVPAGEIVTLLERADEDFWIAQVGRRRGFVQADYVEVIQSAPGASKPKRKARPPPAVPSRTNTPVGVAGEPATPRGSEHFGAPPPSLMDNGTFGFNRSNNTGGTSKGAPPPVPSRGGKPKAAPPVPSRGGKPKALRRIRTGSSRALGLNNGEAAQENAGSLARRNRIAALSQRRVAIEERQRQEAIEQERQRKEAAERKRQQDARALREKQEAERRQREEEARLEKERQELEATRARERALAEEQKRAQEQALAAEERQRLEAAKAELQRQRREQEEKLARERARVEAERKRAAEEAARKKAALEAERRAEQERKQAERKKAAERRAAEEQEAARLKAEEERLAREQEEEAKTAQAALAKNAALSPSLRPKGPAPARPSRNRRKSNVAPKPAMVRASESKAATGGDSDAAAAAAASKSPAPKRRKSPAPKRRAQKKGGGIAARMAMWNKRANDYQEGQESNVFSASYKGGGGKLSKRDAGYGQAKAGSKTEARAKAAKEWCVPRWFFFSVCVRCFPRLMFVR